jgi:hypothetical protein
LLHQVRDLQRLLDVGLVGHQLADFGRESASTTFALGGLSDGLASRFGARDAAASGDLLERAQTIAAEA